MKGTSKLKSYTCVKCGAVLSVDKLHGQMACPFCGNEFDYVDFHRDDLIRQAEECLARGAYGPAREKFDKVLENDPKDIEAYRGLILCAGRIQSTEDLRNRYDQVSSDLDVIKKIVSSAKEYITKEESAYLDNLVSLFEIPKAYNNIRSRKEKSIGLDKKRELLIEAKDERDGILARILGISIFVLMGLVILLIGSFDGLDFISGFGRVILLILIIGVISLDVFLFIEVNSKIAKNPDSVSSLSDKMAYAEEKHLEILSEVLEYEASFMKKPEEKVMLREDKKQDSETVVTGPVICAKCGGVLKLNSALELYECNSCGVSYGKYLFFGDLTANAVKAMDMGEFDEADQILSHKLSMNPKDSDALLGRFLCAGRWKDLKDIDINDRMFMARVKKLPDRLDAIEKSISKADHPLWEDLRKLSELFAEYADRRHAYNMVYEKHRSVSGKLSDTFLMNKEIEDYTRQKDELEEKVTVLESECQEAAGRINEVLTALTDAGSGCVFFRR